MAKESPSLYSIAKTFMWFAVMSVLLTAGLVAIVLLDHNREWKDWQRKFTALKAQGAQRDLQEAAAAIDKEKLEDLKKQSEEAAATLKTHEREMAEIRGQSERLNTLILKTKSRYQDLKQFQDSYRYYFEEYSHHGDKRADGYRRLLDEITPKVENEKIKLEGLEKEKEEKDASLESFYKKGIAVKKEVEKILEEQQRLASRLQNLKPSPVKDILNAPMLDFLAPTLRIQQVVLEDLYDDFHFAKVQKVDRCTTCHLGIDQKGFEEAPQPFRTHPKLELFLGTDSPHPVEKFGCTVCHGGNGHSVSFKDAAHTPQSESQAKEWKKKYHWGVLEKWDDKMLPLKHTEASCTKCHANVVEVPMAAKLNEGRKLAETFGCVNCHKIKGYSELWKVGPDLRNVKDKVSKEWLMKWLEDPAHFRPSTKMPKVFNLSNTSSPEDIERNKAAIASIAEYLIKNSESADLKKMPVSGDPVRGEKLVKEVGCTGCHNVSGVNADDHGPELSGLGSKVSADWLYTWLKNPKHISPETRMPDLRLSDQEAADIVSYLISLKNPDFDAKLVPQPKQEFIDELILANLQSNMRRLDAEKELSEMNSEQKLEYLGKRSVSHQGCYSCHTIKGFEDAKPIGTELSNEGLKEIHQFDFGFVDIEKARHDWFVQKLKNPRIFDDGKQKSYYEKLRMPQFNLTDDQIEALTTFLLSLTEERVPMEMQRRLDLKEQKIEKGRPMVAKFNCNGCHQMDGKPGSLREYLDDKGAAPPILDGEGAKTQEKWLHAFLQHPTTIRPWLTYRMPSFDLTEEETKALVEYFAYLAHQEVSYQGLQIPTTTTEKLESGKVLFEKLQCAKCHVVNKESSAMGASFLAPDLGLTKERLKPEWVKEWMRDPEALMEGTMMPGFFPDGQSPVEDILGGDAGRQIEAIRDYLYTYESPVQSDR